MERKPDVDKLDERNTAGAEALPDDEEEAVIEAAEHNPDRTTQREAIEQELMELDESEAGSEIGD
jgi:hypothetical protein